MDKRFPCYGPHGWLAYVDALGTSATFEATGSDATKLQELLRVTDSIRSDAERSADSLKGALVDLQVHWTVVSDSVFFALLSAQENKLEPSITLLFLANSARSVQQAYLNHGFLSRGAMTHGIMWANDSSLVGYPVVEVVKVEREQVQLPFVKVLPALSSACRFEEIEEDGWFIECHGSLFVNLIWDPNPTQLASWRPIIAEGLIGQQSVPRNYQKWCALRDVFNLVAPESQRLLLPPEERALEMRFFEVAH